MLTLSDAIKSGRLKEFIAQEEKRGIGPVDLGAFDRLAESVIKKQQSEDQTSHSPARDSSSGK